jgi:hypothetical protein
VQPDHRQLETRPVSGTFTVADLAVNNEENPYLPCALATVSAGIPLMIAGAAQARSGETDEVRRQCWRAARYFALLFSRETQGSRLRRTRSISSGVGRVPGFGEMLVLQLS